MIRRIVTTLLLGAVILSSAVPAVAGDVHVRPYIKRDGTYVQPHFRSAPDGTRWNNWSTKGNVNPYTGQPGTKSPFDFGSGGSSGGSNGIGGHGNSNNLFVPRSR